MRSGTSFFKSWPKDLNQAEELIWLLPKPKKLLQTEVEFFDCGGPDFHVSVLFAQNLTLSGHNQK